MSAMDKSRVTLTAEEWADFEQLVSRGKAAARKLTDARILLLADEALGDERPDGQVVAALSTSATCRHTPFRVWSFLSPATS